MMPGSDHYYIPHLEWEAIDFPITIQKLRFEHSKYGFEEDALITIWREDSLQLRSRISGRLKEPNIRGRAPFIGKGNIVRQETIWGNDLTGNPVTLNSCALDGLKTNSWEVNEQGYQVEMEVIFDTVEIVFKPPQEGSQDISAHFEWFLCDHIQPHFNGTTCRSTMAPLKKTRIDIDPYDRDNEKFTGRSFSSDFIRIELPELRFIVAKVPTELTGKAMEGLCLEFRDDQAAQLTPALLSELRHFFAFVLGCKLYYMGNSEISRGALKTALLDSPDIPLKVKSAMPPIHYNLQYEWGNFALQANLMLEKFLKVQNSLSLNSALERFWIFKEIPVGANLPVLASAVEIIASKYLKMTGNDQLAYLSQQDYQTLISDELRQLDHKLSKLDGGNIMLNKITGAFRKGPNEKINLFFSLLGLDTGKTEKEAINLRNKMTHGARDYSDDNNVHDDVVLTRVYEVLFHRILLKLLDYDGYYIDYSMEGSPSKPLAMKAGDQ